MKKEHYQKELNLSATQQRGGSNSSKEVKKIQSWLTLYEMAHPGSGTAVEVDGIFGPATDAAVRKFQQLNSLPAADGVVDAALYELLTIPMRKAFTLPSGSTTLRERIVTIASNHLRQQPFELVLDGQSNSGPWVRSYMDNNEGESWRWCMGFVQAVLDQAASEMGKDFRQLMPHSYSCDTVGAHGEAKGYLIRNQAWKDDPTLVKPGDIFLVRRTKFDWTHTGIILNPADEIIETIEGNTNFGGSANGNGVYRRLRNFRDTTMDVFSIEAFV